MAFTVTGIGGRIRNAAYQGLQRAKDVQASAKAAPQAPSFAETQTKALNDPAGEFAKRYAGREADLASQYAQTRTAMGAQKAAATEEMKRGIQRQVASQGGAGGGAALKTISKGQTELGKQFGSLEAGLGAEEAAARQGLAGEKGQERFQREQAIQAGQQFQDTLNFQKSSFDKQMAYSWAELDENKKTNLINAAALLKSEGFMDMNPDELSNLWKSGFGDVYSNILPVPTRQRSSNYISPRLGPGIAARSPA